MKTNTEKWELDAGESVLILGGARSGKSRFAEALAQPFARVAYVATAQPLDAEMAERIRAHRKRRNPNWLTVEEPKEVLARLREQAPMQDVILLDCLTLWLSNLLADETEDDLIARRSEELADFLRDPGCRVVCVTNEVGAGIVPGNPLARRFRDLAGTANQQAAATCHKVFWMAAGIPVRVK